MAGTKDPKATYIDYSARAWSTTADGIFAEAGQVLDRTQNKDQQAINAEVKANLARIEGIAGSAAAGAYIFKGSLNGLADLLLLTNVKVGDVYNIKTEFTLSGGKYPAGTNVAATKAMSASTADGWDALGGVTLDLAPINQKISNLESGKYDANKVVTTSATNDDAHVLTAKATHDVANSAATDSLSNFKTTDYELFKQQTSSALDKKIEEGRLEDRSRVATEQAINHANALIVNDKNNKTSTDRVLSVKATYDAIANALDVVAPDVTALTTSVENIKKFVTVPFDGYTTGAITVESMSTENVAQILYDMKSKSFVAKGTDGKYYNSWRVPDTDGRQRDLYIDGMASHPKKLYVYNGEIYTLSSLGLSLTLGKTLSQVTGTDAVRGVSQQALSGEFTKLNNLISALTGRVGKLEDLLKLA